MCCTYKNFKTITKSWVSIGKSNEKNYPITNWFSENLLAIEMKKTKLKIREPVYLGLSILGTSKTFTYEFWYDYLCQIIESAK